ncbi:MAG: glycosyltransferase [Victivallales bacterium]|nr:glycosyltransferase [Victivallales bacterium]
MNTPLDSSSANPSMSFLMITYNQEKTIEQALKSALAQDYPNLEIVICDDCSKDRTFEIASKIATEYHGPFKIILQRNDPNLGIGANFHKAFTLATGEWLFMAAGDDISTPGRCRAVADGIRQFPNALAFGSNYEIIDGDSKRIGFSRPEQLLGPGAVIAWHRSVFTSFAPLGQELKVEDAPLYPRVFLLGGTYVKLPQVTLQYRMDGHSFTGQDRDNALNVQKYFLKVRKVLDKVMEHRFVDIATARTFPTENKWLDLLEERQKWVAKDIREDISAREETIRILEASFMSKLHFLFFNDAPSLHKGFAQRLKLILSNYKLLIWLKRKIFKPVGWSEMIAKETVPELPANLSAQVIDARHYLTHVDCDYCGSDYFDSFERGFLTPERRKVLQIP